MLRLLRLLIYGTWQLPRKCTHQWKVKEETTLKRPGIGVIGKLYVSQCEKCGEMKSYKVNV